ncbi:MAG: histidine kinase [Pseudomonadota bacterium]
MAFQAESLEFPDSPSVLNRRTVLIVLGLWLALGGFYLTGTVLNARAGGDALTLDVRMLAGTAIVFLSWGALNLILLTLVHRLAGRVGAGAQVLAVAVGGLAWLPVNLVIDRTTSAWMSGRPIPGPLEALASIDYLSAFFITVFFLLAAFGSVFWVYLRRWQHARETTLRLERAQAEARHELETLHMQILKSQLSPHFLFNALGSVAALARTAPRERIVQTLQILGDLLRHSLTAAEQPVVPIEEEIRFTRNYIRIQELRFGDRCEFKLANDGVGPNASCPPFVLQTLVENAFHHGVEKRRERSIIDARLTMNAEDGRLRIETINDLPEPRLSEESGMGMALDNLRHRLSLLYGDDAEVRGETVANGTYHAQVILPRWTPDS